jgi:hypothetical protein
MAIIRQRSRTGTRERFGVALMNGRATCKEPARRPTDDQADAGDDPGRLKTPTTSADASQFPQITTPHDADQEGRQDAPIAHFHQIGPAKRATPEPPQPAQPLGSDRPDEPTARSDGHPTTVTCSVLDR